jgi:ATP-dependent helicase HrpA
MQKNGSQAAETPHPPVRKKIRPALKPRPVLKNKPAHLNFAPDLPVTARKEEIIQAIKTSQVVIISGETGSGKTTQIPKCCLAAGCGTRGMIGCTQPRRIAAINVAKRIAFEFKESLGQSVGYKIRFDDKTPPNACIKVMTDGILLAETQQDRFLKQYDTLIVDEAHERSLNIDFTLGILRRLVKQRKHLKLIITSATIDTKKFSDAFDQAPIIEVSGRMFPVETIYQPILGETGESQSLEDQGYVEAAADAAHALLSRTRSGDMLIFMPTEQDIGETMTLIRGHQHPGVTVLPLFARLSAREQAKVFSRTPGRKIIVSTNVAETSLTIPGIRYVIDTGLARIPSYSPRTRTTALPVRPISQSSANQRLGRCGRVENGVCIRLYDEDDFNGRPFFTAPEILRSNLAEVILRMIFLNLGDVQQFPFIDPPAPKSIKDGFDTLVELGAIREKKMAGTQKTGFELTRVGQIMAKIPVDPKLSRILIQAQENSCLAEALVIATALSISDVRQRPAEKAAAADQQHARFKDPTSDFVTLLNIWDACKAAEKKLKTRTGFRQFCIDHFLSFKRFREWQDIHNQIRRLLEEHGFKGFLPYTLPPGTAQLKSREHEIGGPLYMALHKSLLAGYLSHIAHKKEKNIYTAAKGQQVMIFPGSGLFDRAGPWIVAAEFVKTSQLFARGVANIDPSWLEEIGKDLCTRTWADPRWEKNQGQVLATEQVSLFGLVIVSGRPVAYGKLHPEEAGDIFIRKALVEE